MMQEIEEEIEIIDVREEQVKELINQFMKGEKALSFSSLKAFAENPQEFIQYQLREKKTTVAMAFGTMVHCLILEPDDFENRYTIMDDTTICSQIGGAKPRVTNKYKEWKQGFEEENQGKEIVSIKDFQSAVIISNNVIMNRASRKIIHMCTEHEIYVEWNYESMKNRGYLDMKTPADKKVKAKADLKTCADANPAKFQRDIIKNKYYLQAAMYDESFPDESGAPFYIIAVDKKGGVSVHKLDPKLIAAGKEEYKKLLDNFNACLLKDSFNQSYDFWAEGWDGIYEMKRPTFML